MIRYSSTCSPDRSDVIGTYDFDFENLQGDGSLKDDTMQVTVVLVSGEDDDGQTWYSWREDCDGGSSEQGSDFRTREEADADARRHFGQMGGIL